MKALKWYSLPFHPFTLNHFRSSNPTSSSYATKEPFHGSFKQSSFSLISFSHLEPLFHQITSPLFGFIHNENTSSQWRQVVNYPRIAQKLFLRLSHNRGSGRMRFLPSGSMEGKAMNETCLFTGIHIMTRVIHLLPTRPDFVEEFDGQEWNERGGGKRERFDTMVRKNTHKRCSTMFEWAREGGSSISFFK